MTSKPSNLSALLGAAFLMATSAVGPGFLTQTTVFTQQLLANFGFVILLSILLDLGAQLNIWRIVAITEKRAQDLANELFTGLGYVLSFLIVLGGLAFNIGNVAGAGLGIEILTGIDVKIGATASAAIAIGLFLVPEAGKAMDVFTKWLGILMILLIMGVVFIIQPPLIQAISHTFIPQKFDAIATITLVGGTVGGYITFSGAHRLLDAGITGQNQMKDITKSAMRGILLTSVIRYLLFLAALGSIMSGGIINSKNPTASVFEIAVGGVGLKIFGVVMWSAAITSVVGSAYTSVTFLRSLHHKLEQNHRYITILFIIVSTTVFIAVGKPVQVLVWVGTLNGFILPISLTIMLLASRRKRLVGDYKHPALLQIAGWLVVLLMTLLVLKSLI